MSLAERLRRYYARQGSGPEPGGPHLSVDDVFDALDQVDNVFSPRETQAAEEDL